MPEQRIADATGALWQDQAGVWHFKEPHVTKDISESTYSRLSESPAPTLGNNIFATSRESVYSSLEHLARSVWPVFSIEGLFAMISSYFDGAGGKDHGFIVVAGYVSKLWKWEKFAVDWSIALARYQVPYFHMKEFSQSKGPFKSWEGLEGKRKYFLSTLVDILREHVEFGVATFVPYAEFQEVDKTFELTRWFRKPYVLASRDCTAVVNKEIKRRGWQDPIEYIFEDGADGKGALVERLSAENLSIPSFKPSRDKETTKSKISGVIQLQASDFAAYELRKVMKDHGDDASLWKYRASLKSLASIKSYWRQYTKKNLINLCENGGIARRDIIGS